MTTKSDREAGLTSLQNIRANFDNQLVEETELKGQEHIKAPTVAVTEKVLRYNGGKRALLPEQEIVNSVKDWNFTPITIDHPTDRGRNLSATQPDVMDESVVGLFMNARYDRDKKSLKGDVYLNKEWLQQHHRGDEVLNRLREGDLLEVSTAYRAPGAVRENGKYNGEAYNVIQKDIRPNHFALLLDKPGRCSLEDGCGFPRVNSESDVDAWEMNMEEDHCCDSCAEGHICEDVIDNALSRAREITWEGGLETREDQSWGAVGKDMATWWEGYTRNTEAEGDMPSSYSAAPTEFKRWQSNRTLLGEQSAGTWEEANVLPVVNPITDSLNEGGLIAAKAAARGSRGATFSPEQSSSVVTRVNNLLINNFDFTGDDFETNNMEQEIDEEEAKSAFTKLMNALGFGGSEPIDNSSDEDELEPNSTNSDMEEEQEDQVEKSEEEEDLNEAEEVEAEESDETSESSEAESNEITVDRDELVDIVSETVEEKLNESEAVAAVQNSVDREREQLQDHIVSNSKMDEDDVEEMSTEQLYKLERSLDSDHYGVRPKDEDVSANSDDSRKAVSPPNFFEQNNE